MRSQRSLALSSVVACTLVVAGLLLFSHRSIAPAMSQTAPTDPMPLAYEYVPSMNCDARPPNTPVSCIVIHATVEPTTEGTMNIFLTPAKKVSAHFVVGRDGRVVQMVPIEKRAWHAGVSVLDGVPKVNDYSVGIEMVNLNDGKDPYPDAQVQAVAGIIRFVRSRYNVPDERIVSHEQIALPAGRKNDPVAFDFARVKALARITAATAPAAPLQTIPPYPPLTPPADGATPPPVKP